jgi:hypothetical protein
MSVSHYLIADPEKLAAAELWELMIKAETSQIQLDDSVIDQIESVLAKKRRFELANIASYVSKLAANSKSAFTVVETDMGESIYDWTPHQVEGLSNRKLWEIVSASKEPDWTDNKLSTDAETELKRRGEQTPWQQPC